jgi:hypothetical protein
VGRSELMQRGSESSSRDGLYRCFPIIAGNQPYDHEKVGRPFAD